MLNELLLQESVLIFLKPAVFEMGKGWELGGEAKISLLTALFYISDKLGFGRGECPNKHPSSQDIPDGGCESPAFSLSAGLFASMERRYRNTADVFTRSPSYRGRR